MCGRARCALNREAYLLATGLDPGHWQPHLADQYEPRNNLAPGGWLPVIRTTSTSGNVPEVAICKWGLVPSFHKQDDKFDHWLMFNARSETVTTSPVFRRLMPHKRCIVLLNGFYEWKAEAGGRKQPYYIYLKHAAPHDGKPQDTNTTEAPSPGVASPRKAAVNASPVQPTDGASPCKSAGKSSASDQLMAVAALWDVTTGPDGQPLPTVSILTCDSCSSLTWLHDRMPVILDSKAAAETWLGAALPDTWAVHDNSTHGVQPARPAADAIGHADVKQGHAASKVGHASVKEGAVQATVSGQATAGSAETDSGQVKHEQLQETVKTEAMRSEQAGSQQADAGQEEEGSAPVHSHKGLDPALVIQQVCHPYAGANLAWHPVTPQMTKLEYQSEDCCMDVRSRKGTITSFFSPKKAAGAAKNADDCRASGDVGSAKKKSKLL